MQMHIVDTEDLKRDIEAEGKPQNAEAAELQQLAQRNANEIMTLDLESTEEKRKIIKAIDDFAIDTLQHTARKNSLLQTTIGELSKGGEDGNVVSNSLADLHREIRDLDPSSLDFTKDGLLGKLFNPIRRYFDRYKKADGVIRDIIVSLDKGKETLKNDNTTLDLEEDALRELTKKLNRDLTMGIALDERVSEQIDLAKAGGGDEDKIRFVTEEILFPLRQRMMDMQQMVVVNQQGIIAIEVIKRNNKELIRGVDRAKTVTVTALRTAVMVASALYNQKIVLQKIDMLNETTSNLITSTSRMLKDQGAAIQRQASESAISPEVLRQAFNDAITALNDISTFKQQALPQMQQAVAQFREMAETGEREIARLEKAEESKI